MRSQGIAIRNSVNLSGSSTLVAVGTMESLSGGILLYASIATLLVGDWLNGEMIHASNKRVAVGATFFAVVSHSQQSSRGQERQA